MVVGRSSPSSWVLFVFTPVPKKVRKIQWKNLANLTSLHTVPWIVVGDFNEVLCHSEKFGALPLCLCWITSFQRRISACNSYRFHWLQLHFDIRCFLYLIKERQDRTLANSNQRLSFLKATLTHILNVHSNHCPILLPLPSIPHVFLVPLDLNPCGSFTLASSMSQICGLIPTSHSKMISSFVYFFYYHLSTKINIQKKKRH